MQTHLLNILITWRLTELLVDERGFYAIFDRVREYVHSQGHEHVGENPPRKHKPKDNIWSEISKMLECRYCTSVTVGIAVAIATRQNPLIGLGYSAGSLFFGGLLERGYK